LAIGISSKIVAENAKGRGRVAETLGSLCGGSLFEEIGTEGFVLAVSGVLRALKEGAAIRKR